MSDKGSVFQKGGGGTNFEQTVQAAFITTMMLQTDAPCLPSNKITEIVLQSTNRGWQTDDILVIAESDTTTHNLLIQIKHTLTFSDNEVFNEVIAGFWKDFNNSAFNSQSDKLVIIKNRLNNIEKNHIKSIFNFAKNHTSAQDFYSEIERVKEKTEKLKIFEAALTKANDSIPVEKEKVWGFLRVTDLLGYDFLDQNSVDELNIVNLIKLTKSSASPIPERAIWSSIVALVAKYNSDGGSITIDSLSREEFYQYFKFEQFQPFRKSIDKIISDSQLIVKPIKNIIGIGEQSFHLPRTELIDTICTSINSFPVTLVSGKPGAGKTAAVADALKQNFDDSAILVFRADQFNRPHLSNVFADMGIFENLQDLLSCMTHASGKVIFIDSLEKLLEDADPGNAFKQILQLISTIPDLKLVCTTRTYAIDLLNQKFGIDEILSNRVKIDLLTDEDLKQVAIAIPALENVMANFAVKELIRSPKYLDFALKAQIRASSNNFPITSIVGFKEQLWDSLIRNSTHRQDGLPARRETDFINIVVKRAKEMTLFVRSNDLDEQVIDLLEADELLFKDGTSRRYSPTHDILEDWGLIRYISLKYDQRIDNSSFFNEIGNEPAIRRAFRLWVEDSLERGTGVISGLLADSLSNSNIENYWADEVLIAVFKSKDAKTFFATFAQILIANEATLLNRCIHLIKTTCKESQDTGIDNRFIPVGSGWEAVLMFIRDHLLQLDNLRFSIHGLLSDWEYRPIFSKDATPDELKAATDITIFYLNQVEALDSFWDDEDMKDSIDQLIYLSFTLAGSCKRELEQMISRANDFLENDSREGWEKRDFYKRLIRCSLSGLRNVALIKELPMLIIDTMNKNWKVKERESDIPEGITGRIMRSSLSRDQCWGIREKSSFSPSGIYKTPILWLLRLHPVKALSFIIDFLNEAVEHYVTSDCEYKHDLHQIDLVTKDRSRKIWSGLELWNAFRGTSVTHDCIECILMSLERFLFEFAEDENTEEYLQGFFNYLINNTNNVAVISVLASVSMAYPHRLNEQILLLFGNKDFYFLDQTRYTSERTAMSPMDDYISFAQGERHRSNQLTHRTAHYRGLIGFVIHHQFNIRKYNKDLFDIFDRLKKELDTEDIIWEKILTEIDTRNHEISEYKEELKGFEIAPKYSQKVQEFIDSGKEDFQEQNISAGFAQLIRNAYEGDIPMHKEDWNRCYQHYIKTTRVRDMFDRQVTLAAIGLRDLEPVLDREQTDWCNELLLGTIENIIAHTYSRSFEFGVPYNIMEKDIAIESLHLVRKNPEEQASFQIVYHAIHLIVAHFSDHEVQKITRYFRETFFRHLPSLTEPIIMGVLKYAQYMDEHPFDHAENSRNENYRKERLQAIDDFIKKLSSGDFSKFDDGVISKSNELTIVARAILSVPYYLEQSRLNGYTVDFLKTIFLDLNKEEEYDFPRRKKARQIDHMYASYLRDFFAELLLNSKGDNYKLIIDVLLTEVRETAPQQRYHRRDDKQEFISRFFTRVVVILDNKLSLSKYENNQVNTDLITKFWELWNYTYDEISQKDIHSLDSILLLGIEWRDNADQWLPFESGQSHYYRLVQKLGDRNLRTIVKVIATVGSKQLLPAALSWIVAILKSNPRRVLFPVGKYAEQLIKRLYLTHISMLKADPVRIAEFIFLLDEMVKLGSSSAYFYREHVITYKAHAA